jgi:hypothetical protein
MGIILENPQIVLLKGLSGTWNFSNLGPENKTLPTSERSSASSMQDNSRRHLAINNGKLIVGKANSIDKPTVYETVNIIISNF